MSKLGCVITLFIMIIFAYLFLIPALNLSGVSDEIKRSSELHALEGKINSLSQEAVYNYRDLASLYNQLKSIDSLRISPGYGPVIKLNNTRCLLNQKVLTVDWADSMKILDVANKKIITKFASADTVIYIEKLLPKDKKAHHLFETEGWSKKDCLDIQKGTIRIGFSKEKTKAAWGKPNRIEKYSSAYGSHETWYYPTSILTFEDGYITSFSN